MSWSDTSPPIVDFRSPGNHGSHLSEPSHRQNNSQRSSLVLACEYTSSRRNRASTTAKKLDKVEDKEKNQVMYMFLSISPSFSATLLCSITAYTRWIEIQLHLLFSTKSSFCRMLPQSSCAWLVTLNLNNRTGTSCDLASTVRCWYCWSGCVPTNKLFIVSVEKRFWCWWWCMVLGDVGLRSWWWGCGFVEM